MSSIDYRAVRCTRQGGIFGGGARSHAYFEVVVLEFPENGRLSIGVSSSEFEGVMDQVRVTHCVVLVSLHSIVRVVSLMPPGFL